MRQSREERKEQRTKEERLDLKNEYGIKDPTPQMAVDEIRAAE